MRMVLLKPFARWRSPQICLDESRLAKCNTVLLREVQRLNAQLHNLSEMNAELSKNYSSVLADNFKLRLEVNHARSRTEHVL